MSVIVPMYNTRKYIWTCIESIFEQTFQDFEIILIDDCSTDGSLEFVLDHFHDNRLQIFRNRENFGTGYTLNFGIKNSIGDYIYILDSDDAILPETLETLLKTAEEYSADVVHMSRYFTAPDEDFRSGKFSNIEIRSAENFTLGLQPANITRLKEIGIATNFPAWHNFFRREYLHVKKILEPEIRINVDVFFTATILLTAERFVKIDQPLYVYRQNSNSLSNEKLETRFKKIVSSMPIATMYMKKLFERDDLIAQLTPSQQKYFTSDLLIVIFVNAFAEFGNDIWNLPQTSKILTELASTKEFTNPEFLSEFVQFFYTLAVRIWEE